MTNARSMLPILPLLLILLFSGPAGVQASARTEPGEIFSASLERRTIAALVQTVREEAEREALASTVVPRSLPATPLATGESRRKSAVRRSDRVRDGPVV